jgi:hypothetical protein
MEKRIKAALFIDQIVARLITEHNGFADFTAQTESHYESHPRYQGEGSNQARFGRDPYHGSNNEYSENRQEEEIMKKYFHQLEEMLLPYDEIMLFGPGQVKKELHNYLEEQAAFRGKKIHVQNSDHQTERQLLETAGSFFYI